MKKTTIIYLLFVALLLSSCATNKHFLRADVIGFSDAVRTSYDSKRGVFSGITLQSAPYNLLNVSQDNATGKSVISISPKGKMGLQDALRSTPRGDMTAVDYAMVLAAKRINYVRRNIAMNDPNTKYYILIDRWNG